MSKERNSAERFQKFFSDITKSLKENFGKDDPGKPDFQKFMNAVLKDGTKIYYDGEMPMEGMPLWVIPSDGGDPIPAPDAIHTLEDGSQIQTEKGVIVAVKPAGAPAAAADPNATVTPPAADMTGVPATEAVAKRVIESHIKEHVYTKQEADALVADAVKKAKEEQANEIATLRSANETLTQEFAKLKTAFASHEAFASDMKKAIAELGEQPQVTPEKDKKEFKKEDKPAESREEWQKKYGIK